MEYTKGEWYKVYDRENDSYHIYARQEKASDIWLAEIEDIANAQLIASSPRLYEALKGLLKDYSTNPLDDDFYMACVKARQALAKAEGK